MYPCHIVKVYLWSAVLLTCGNFNVVQCQATLNAALGVIQIPQSQLHPNSIETDPCAFDNVRTRAQQVKCFEESEEYTDYACRYDAYIRSDCYCCGKIFTYIEHGDICTKFCRINSTQDPRYGQLKIITLPFNFGSVPRNITLANGTVLPINEDTLEGFSIPEIGTDSFWNFNNQRTSSPSSDSDIEENSSRGTQRPTRQPLKENTSKSAKRPTKQPPKSSQLQPLTARRPPLVATTTKTTRRPTKQPERRNTVNEDGEGSIAWTSQPTVSETTVNSARQKPTKTFSRRSTKIPNRSSSSDVGKGESDQSRLDATKQLRRPKSEEDRDLVSWGQ